MNIDAQLKEDGKFVLKTQHFTQAVKIINVFDDEVYYRYRYVNGLLLDDYGWGSSDFEPVAYFKHQNELGNVSEYPQEFIEQDRIEQEKREIEEARYKQELLSRNSDYWICTNCAKLNKDTTEQCVKCGFFREYVYNLAFSQDNRRDGDGKHREE